jgi:hypothetical protein
LGKTVHCEIWNKVEEQLRVEHIYSDIALLNVGAPTGGINASVGVRIEKEA